MTQILDVHRPSEEYSDCLSLPPEWMEIIDPNYCYKNIEGGRYVSDVDFNINGKRS